jgi:2-hydroxychromene-2-carboxylate isomerase
MRLATACDANGHPNRFVCEQLFKHVWDSGLEAADSDRLNELTQTLAPARAPDAQDVKDQLRAATEQAIAKGVFGVPTIEVNGELFWGQDALPMLKQFLDGDNWFQGEGWQGANNLPTGIQRKR